METRVGNIEQDLKTSALKLKGEVKDNLSYWWPVLLRKMIFPLLWFLLNQIILKALRGY